MGRLSRNELRSMVADALPAMSKEDLYWQMFFEGYNGPFDRSDVEAYVDFVTMYDMMIRKIIWCQVGAGRWEFDHTGPPFHNLRVKESWDNCVTN